MRWDGLVCIPFERRPRQQLGADFRNSRSRGRARPSVFGPGPHHGLNETGPKISRRNLISDHSTNGLSCSYNDFIFVTIQKALIWNDLSIPFDMLTPFGNIRPHPTTLGNMIIQFTRVTLLSDRSVVFNGHLTFKTLRLNAPWIFEIFCELASWVYQKDARDYRGIPAS